MEPTNQSDAKQLIESSDQTLVIDFYAEWCGPCKMLSPVIESLAPEYEGKLKVIKVDIDESPDLAQEYQVVSVPTIVVIKGGSEADRMVGFQSKDVLKSKFDAVAG